METAGQVPEYYADLRDDALLESIRNFDDPSNLSYFAQRVSSHRTRNFFIDFGDKEAWSGFDLEATSYIKLLKAPVRL
jgi:hypothetical protein